MTASKDQPSKSLDDVCDIGDELGLSDPLLSPPVALRRSIPKLDHRAADLVVVRESDEFDHILMEGCIQHSLSYCTQVPGHAEAVRLGIGPLLRPEEHRGDVRAVMEIRQSGTRAVLFLIGTTYFLYSEGSAAKSNADGENNFTMILIAVVEKLRPYQLHVVAISRLVRSFDHAGLVQSAVTRYVDTVMHAGRPIAMRGEGQEIGQLIWSTLAAISASERNLIVQRLTAGIVAKYRRGQWTVGRHSVPLGFIVDSSGSLVLDETQAELVAFVWNLMARPSITARRLVQEVGAAGVSSLRLRKHYGEHATVAAMRTPRHFVDQMIRYAPLHLSGTHTQLLANPFPGASHLASLPVHPPTEKRPNGHVEFEYNVGIPDGGWVDPALVREAIRVRSTTNGRIGSRAHDRVAPLMGLEWIQSDLHYRICRPQEGMYEIRVRPLPTEAN